MIKRLDLKVGFQCNNRCRFCVQGDKRKTFSNKTDGEIRRILKNKKKNYQGVVFTGGEPTIRKEIFEWVKCAKDLGYKLIQIQTNGRMFAYKSFCEKLIESGANQFALAIHGSKTSIHDYLTRSEGSFKQTFRGIQNLKGLKQEVLINTVINKVNYKDLPDIARLLTRLNVDQFQFAFIHINQIILNNINLINTIVPRHSKVEPYVKNGLQIGIDKGVKVMTEAIPYCFMSGYEKYLAETLIPDTGVVDGDFEISNYTNYRKSHGKAKGPNCSFCKFFNICEGPWKEYPRIFGWDEFKPVFKSKT